MDLEAAEQEVDRIMSVADSDLNGNIDYSEFISATMDKKKLLSKERLKTAFQIFDKVSTKIIY
jgi:calcium-dependent protein kinase